MSDAPQTPESSPRKERLTDSPWLWAAIYTGFGLAMLLVTGGKFGKRQAGIENKYQARAVVASGKVQVAESGTGEKAASGAPEYTTPESVEIPIWPLEIILGVICAASFYLLLRQRMGAHSPSLEGTGPTEHGRPWRPSAER